MVRKRDERCEVMTSALAHSAKAGTAWQALVSSPGQPVQLLRSTWMEVALGSPLSVCGPAGHADVAGRRPRRGAEVTADQSDGIGAVRDARHVVAVLNTTKEVFNTPSLSSREGYQVPCWDPPPLPFP